MSVRYGARSGDYFAGSPGLVKDADGRSTLASRNARGRPLPLCLPHYLA